jgi:hypothetical protein
MFKMLVILCFAFFALSSFAKTTHQIFPDNDLWKEDTLDNKSIDTQIVFDKINDIAYSLYKPFADANNEQLVINHKWTDSTVNANCLRSGGVVTVNMYGGLARRPEIGPEGFALVVCHELGHAYGGKPYIQVNNRMSAEGQADYYGAKDCQKKVIALLKLETTVIPETSFMTKACSEVFVDEKEADICVQALIGGQELGNLLAVLKKEPTPNYETPDPYVIPQTTTTYAKTTQCRLDTYLAGTLNKVRPACWFKN